MPDRYTVKHLSLDDVARAYPLLQSVDSDLSFERWKKYAAGRLTPGASASRAHTGIVAVENSQGYLQGLFGYRVDTDLKWGLTLQCENLVALSLVKPGPVFAVLMEAMESLARKRGCKALQVTVRQPSEDQPRIGRRYLETAGLSAESIRFCKHLDLDAG